MKPKAGERKFSAFSVDAERTRGESRKYKTIRIKKQKPETSSQKPTGAGARVVSASVNMNKKGNKKKGLLAQGLQVVSF